jgi:hypothetical protein
MHTLMVITSGFTLLGIFLLAGRAAVGASKFAVATSAKYFIPIWLVVALLNMWFGVVRAGYPVLDEAPVFVIVFCVPAAVAYYLWRKYSPRDGR